jgi:predicted MFS family arabinose efflux permease
VSRRALFADRNFRVLFLGQTLNMVGSQAMVIVLGIWVKELTGSNSAAGLIFLLLAALAPLAPFTGLLVDRLPRRRVLIGNDLVTAVLVLSLLTVSDRGDVWILYLVTVGYGLSSQIYRAARGGLVHSMIPDDQLGEANGLFSALGQGLRILGPVLGAGVYAVAGGGAVATLDAVTFLASAGCYLALRGAPDLTRAAPETPPKLFGELVAGLRHVFADRAIRTMVLSAAVAFAAAGSVDVAMFALVDEGLGRSPTFLGVLGAVQGAGSVLAGLAVGRLIARLGEFATASLGFALVAVGLLGDAAATLPTAVAGALLAGLGLPTLLVAYLTLVQRRTANELQGRTIAAAESIIDVPFAASIGAGALLISVVGFRAIYVVDAVVFALVAGVLLRTARRAQAVQTA